MTTSNESKDFITGFDERGRESKIERAAWLDSVFLPAIQAAMDNPDALYQHVVQGLQDDFVAEVLPAAKHLVVIDKGSERAHVVLAIVLMKCGELQGAQMELEACMASHGRTGIALTNLAKVQAAAGDQPSSMTTLREALALDPNQENGLMWYASACREEGGTLAYLRALKEIARVPGAWRPQFWIAREALAEGDQAEALRLYEHVLAHASDDGDVLASVSGDLGNAGLLAVMVDLIADRYEPALHGPHAGMNLARALKELGRTNEAMAMVRRVQDLNLPPFAAALAQLEQEISTAAGPQTSGAVPQIIAVPIEGPLWTRGLYDPVWLQPDHAGDLPSIAFVALANETTQAETNQSQAVDQAGRITRAIPLYLAERFGMSFAIRSTCVLLVAKDIGPAVFEKSGNPESLATFAPSEGSMRLVVGGALTSSGIRLDIWDVDNRRVAGIVTLETPEVTDLGALAFAVHEKLRAVLAPLGLLVSVSSPSYYGVPSDGFRHGYVLSLDQLTYQLLVANKLASADSLWNERGFFETYFELEERWSEHAEHARLIAIGGVLAAVTYGSKLVGPYQRMVLRWLDEAPANSLLDRLAPAVWKRLGESQRLENWFARAPKSRDPRYLAWLERVRMG